MPRGQSRRHAAVRDLEGLQPGELADDDPQMRAYVGVTDGEWYRFLAARPEIDEVNFWRPKGARGFGSLTAGEPFLFKSHARDGNKIVGGAFYSGTPDGGLRVSEAWEYFGAGNGSPSLDRLSERIGAYRRDLVSEADPVIGCVLLRDVTFFRPGQVIPAPEDFATNLVQGRGYDLELLDASHSVQRAYLQLLGWHAYDLGESQYVSGPMFGDPRLTIPRVGQQAFKSLLLAAYGRRCAITGDKIQPVLEAAHIRPVELGGEHRLDNGLLLRSDVHTLFDRGYLAIDGRYRLRVSRLLRDNWGNGDEFYRHEGEIIALPGRRSDRPSREFVDWHNDTVFKAS